MMQCCMRQCSNMKTNIPFHPSSSYGQEGADGERGCYKSYLRESNRYIPNENLSMDWYTTLAMLSATMPNVQMARLARV